MAKHLTSERKLRPHKEQSFSANREARPPSELPASSKSARSLLRGARRRRSPWRCRASTTPFWPVIVVVSKAERPKRTRSGRNISPCSNCSPTACNPKKAAINGFEWEHQCGGEVRLHHKRAATCNWNEQARERGCMISSGRAQVHCVGAIRAIRSARLLRGRGGRL